MSAASQAEHPVGSKPPAGPASSVVGYALVAGAAASWGLWPLVLRSAEKIAPMSAAFESSILMVVMAVVAGPLALRDKVARKATPGEWLGIAWPRASPTR